MSNDSRENPEPRPRRSIPSFDYEHLQPMDGVICTTLELPPIVEPEPHQLPTPASAFSVPQKCLPQSFDPSLHTPSSNPLHHPNPSLTPIHKPPPPPPPPPPQNSHAPRTPDPHLHAPDPGWSPDDIRTLVSLRQSGIDWEEIYTLSPHHGRWSVRREYEVFVEREREMEREDAMKSRMREARERDERLLAELRRVGIDRVDFTEY